MKFFKSIKTKHRRERGITLIEVLLTLGIMGILGSVSISVFSGLANSTSFNRDVNIVASYIEKARTASINSVNSLEHGVKFETNKITVFKSASYSAANTEEIYDIPSESRISTISLTGGATSLYFNKLTGAPNVTGTITMTSVTGSLSKVIIIYATGIVDIQ